MKIRPEYKKSVGINMATSYLKIADIIERNVSAALRINVQCEAFMPIIDLHAAISHEIDRFSR